MSFFRRRRKPSTEIIITKAKIPESDLSLPRRLLVPAGLAGLAGAAGILGPREAHADTAFTSFSFFDSAVSASTKRTDPARWGDVINVKSYGATGAGLV